MDYSFKSIRLLIGLPLVIFLAQGCAQNLPAVRQFSEATVVASSSFDVIADDLPKSCERRVEVAFEGKKVTIADGKVEYSREYQRQLGTCASIKESLDGIIAANNVLKDYAEALGRLAADESVNFTADIDTLEASLKKININNNNPFEGPKAVAVSGLARFLFSAATEGYRQRELRRTIEMAHPYFVNLIQALIDVTGDYDSQLRREKQRLVTVQAILIRESKKRDKRRLTEDEINEKLLGTKSQIESIELKQNAARDYIAILQNISETYETLYRSSSELDSNVLMLVVQGYATELEPLINNIREAYAK